MKELEKNHQRNRLDLFQEQGKELELTNLKLEMVKTKQDQVYIYIEITLDDGN